MDRYKFFHALSVAYAKPMWGDFLGEATERAKSAGLLVGDLGGLENPVVRVIYHLAPVSLSRKDERGLFHMSWQEDAWEYYNEHASVPTGG